MNEVLKRDQSDSGLGRSEGQRGWKVTLNIFGSGQQPSSDRIAEATNNAADYLLADDFAAWITPARESDSR